MHQGDGAYTMATDGAEYERREEEASEDPEGVESWLSVLLRR